MRIPQALRTVKAEETEIVDVSLSPRYRHALLKERLTMVRFLAETCGDREEGRRIYDHLMELCHGLSGRFDFALKK